MKRSVISALCGALLAAGSLSAQTAEDYTVKLNLTDDEDGLTAYITDYDTGAKVDSAIVVDGVATFRGTIEKPIFARLILDGNRAGMFILEPGNITVGGENRIGAGTPTNDTFVTLLAKQSEIARAFNQLTPADADKAAQLRADYAALEENALTANAHNPLGYYLFLQDAYNWDLPEFDAKLAEYPQFADSRRVLTLRQGLLNKEETSVGHKFKDFEITYDGTTKRLSDYVGKGKFTLVDFWASWCGPCIRETKVIKELYEEYGPKGLDVLGVAVWDEPQNTLRAIEQHQLPWPQILNTQNVATDIYGIPAIPCIILFDPEGNIVSRDKQDEDLKADVRAALEK